MNAWMLLSLAIGFEVAGTLLLKLSNGFEKVAVGMGAMACYWICFIFLAPALKVIPVGVAYAVWAGLGIAIVTGFGVFIFDQKLGVAQYGFIGLILIGAIGLNLTTSLHGT